tara:strand:- start:335 stop:568 length:234 start_codon:yes stop_codon:yes gene_type:complete
MYNSNTNKFTVENIVDYASMQTERSEINEFVNNIDYFNYPFSNDTITNLQEISDGIFSALEKYDKQRLREINKNNNK